MNSWVQEQFDNLKELAAKNLISGQALHTLMGEARSDEKLATLRKMFEGGNLGDSIFVDVLGANNGNMKQSVEVLLEMIEEQQKVERAVKQEEERLARLKAEAESRRLEEEERALRQLQDLERARLEAENTAVKMDDFVHIERPADEANLMDFENVDARQLSDAQTQTSPHLSTKRPASPPPSYQESAKAAPLMGGAGGAAVPALPKPSAPPMDELELPPEHQVSFNGYPEDSFFYSSWIPMSSYVPSAIKRVIGGDSAPDFLSASVMGTQAKGLKNGLGENNCFLNVVIQSLFHLKAFRNKFNECPDHKHVGVITEQNCPFCALKLIFAQYQYGEDTALPPTSLRQAMSVLGSVQKRFQMGSLDDAAEAHDTLLSALHSCVCNGDENADSFIHKVFSMKVIEYMKCECGKPQKPFPCKQFIFYVSSKALRQQATQHLEVTSTGVRNTITFGEAIKRVNEDDPRQCANEKCTKKNPLRYALANLPEVLTIGIVWNTASPPADYISEVMELIGQQIRVEDMFDSVVQKGLYSLRGMISYYGLHYNAYFRNPKTGEWLLFDDARVAKVGSSWQDVTNKCSSGRWQPFVLWYEYTSA